MLAPHDRKDAELSQVRHSAENRNSTLELLLGQPVLGRQRRRDVTAADHCNAFAKPAKNAIAVGAAEIRIGGVFGVRHQAEHGTALVEDAGDRMRRAVEVGVLVEAAVGRAVTKGDASLAFEPVERVGGGGVVAVVMRHRNSDRLPGVIAASEDRLIVLDAQVHVAAGKLE